MICATSRIQRPSADAKRKNDESDAAFLARLLSTHNVVEVFVPDEECEAAHDLVRAHQDMKADLTRARQRLNMFLMRHGCIWSDKRADGTLKSTWTKEHWQWIRGITFDAEADEDVLALCISEVRHLEAQKKQMERFIERQAKRERWRSRTDALRCLKGIETVTAFALVAEACVFSRFDSAKAYCAWLGLVPGERSSGPKKANAPITKTGNSRCRRLLVEASWHYARAGEDRKAPKGADVPLAVENHAAKAVRRLVRQRRALAKRKKPVVANCATARELACFVWAIGRMCEGTLD